MDDVEDWSHDGRNILSPDRLVAIRNVLENVGPIIVEHWFYYGGRSPDRLVFEDYDDFIQYLALNARPGDALHIWDFSQACRDDNAVASGKYPDQGGRTPRDGAY